MTQKQKKRASLGTYLTILAMVAIPLIFLALAFFFICQYQKAYGKEMKRSTIQGSSNTIRSPTLII